MERRMRWKPHVRCGLGENPEPTAKDYLSALLKFIQLANGEMGIGQRHITLSTCGIVPNIDRLAQENLQINLAISLHSPFQDRREKMMPIAKRYPIGELISAARRYFEKTGRRVTYEYTVIDGTNNRPEDVRELKRLLGGQPHHINLIPLNPVTKVSVKSSNYVKSFESELKRAGLTSTIRKKNGANIEAACGQLRNRESGEC